MWSLYYYNFAYIFTLRNIGYWIRITSSIVLTSRNKSKVSRWKYVICRRAWRVACSEWSAHSRLERDKLCHAKMPPYSAMPLAFNFNARVRERTRVAFTHEGGVGGAVWEQSWTTLALIPLIARTPRAGHARGYTRKRFGPVSMCAHSSDSRVSWDLCVRSRAQTLFRIFNVNTLPALIRRVQNIYIYIFRCTRDAAIASAIK